MIMQEELTSNTIYGRKLIAFAIKHFKDDDKAFTEKQIHEVRFWKAYFA